MHSPNVPFSSPVQPMTGNPPFYPANNDFLLQQLQQQIDFYFSPENLCRDDYLRSILCQNNGAVPVDVIASFPMIKKIVARALLGPAAVFHTDPLALPPVDCNLLRHAVVLNSQTVMVDGMFFVHPEYSVQQQQQHYSTTAFPHTAPQEGFTSVAADQPVDYQPNPLQYPPINKAAASDEVSNRTVATVSPTSFASTVNPSAEEEDDTKFYISVNNIPDDMREGSLKDWFEFKRRPVPKGFDPVFPLSLEKMFTETWKLGFATESEARAAMDILSKRKFRESAKMQCQFMGGHSPAALPVTMLYQTFVLPHREPVYYASAYPYSVLETSQKGIVALPYPPPTATPMYAVAYPSTPVTPVGTSSTAGEKGSQHENSDTVPNETSGISSPQEENTSPPPSNVYQLTPYPRSRRNYNRNKKPNFHNHRKKKDPFSPLVERSEKASQEKKGDRTNALLDKTVSKMAKINLNKD